MTTRASLVLLTLLASAGAVHAVEPCAVVPELELTDVDVDRLSRLEESRAKGSAEAARVSADARQTVADLFEAGRVPIPELPVGDYRCRTIKLGGPLLGFVAYSWFACRVQEAGSGFAIEKLTGSQRFSGELIDVGGGLVFRGADHYADEPLGAYGLDPERNAVGCVSRVSPGAGSYILELPFPFLESTHDVIELVPVQ